MSRRSTNLGTGKSLSSFTCDRCWDGYNTFAPTWAKAEREAMAAGWRFTGHGICARDYCGRCAP